MIYVLAVLPILSLIILSVVKGVKTAVITGCIITIALFFYWGAGITHLMAVSGASLLITVNILMIVLGASFLYNIMFQTGLIAKVSHSLDKLHPSRDIRFFLLAFGLTAFFEGVSGFGTPGAIVPLILMALGFEAILCVSVVLLFDGMFSMFGAVGAPLITGLQIPLGLTYTDARYIGIIAALFMVIAGVLLLFLIFLMMKRQSAPLSNKKQMMVMYAFFAVPYCAFAWLVPELATVLASLCMLTFSVLYLKKGKVNLKPWLPYAVLALLLLLPALFNGLKQWLAWELKFTDLFNTGIGAGFKPLLSPLIPFLLVGLGVAYFYKSKSLQLKESFIKVANVSVVLFPSILIAQLMTHSGVGQPSMVDYIADLMSKMGSAYPLASPFVGIMGTFITGSTTISNLVFGSSQLETANHLSFNHHVILALQLSGASLGNAICLFNIIAAASIANIKNYRNVLVNNLWPTFFAGLLLGLLGILALI